MCNAYTHIYACMHPYILTCVYSCSTSYHIYSGQYTRYAMHVSRDAYLVMYCIHTYRYMTIYMDTRDPCIHICTHIHSGQCMWRASMHVCINIYPLNTHIQCIHTHFQFTHVCIYTECTHQCINRQGNYVLDIYSYILAYIILHYIKTSTGPGTDIHL